MIFRLINGERYSKWILKGKSLGSYSQECNLNRRFFIFGGNDGENAINFIECYNIIENSWSILNVKLPWTLFDTSCY